MTPSPDPSAQVVWLKRDLRLDDHLPLVAAAESGPIVVLYVFEDELLDAPETDAGHVRFQLQALRELSDALRERGAHLTVRRGRMPEVLDALHDELRTKTACRAGIGALWSHQETGLGITYARDLRVAAWCRSRAIEWHEPRQSGVIRRLSDRDGWARRWLEFMQGAPLEAPTRLSAVAGLDHGELPSPDDRGLATLGIEPSARCVSSDPDDPFPYDGVQPGGERTAQRVLRSFLMERGADYRTDMSTPNQGWTGCSRISPHLAWGTLSLRRVYHTTRQRVAELRAERAAGARLDGPWLTSIASFEKRLRWHCHFTQKLEDEPELERVCMARAFEGLREDEFDDQRFAAWLTGHTGYPIVDACMRCLDRTGWLNFRMRAMVVSFAAYHLWLDWRPVALELARRFVDFEPGIHYPQVQMQSGVTGINTLRMYSPTKQLADNDPDGRFVRRWVPELAALPTEHLAAPAETPPLLAAALGFRPGVDYPAPIVAHAPATREARRRIARIRATSDARREAADVVERHGSRRRQGRRPPRAAR